MFDFFFEGKAPGCGPGQSRREFLQIGALGSIGLSLPQYLAAKQAGGVKEGSDNKACILIFNLDGPSQLDLWDMKPEAPSEVRGSFRPIRTKSTGIDISEGEDGFRFYPSNPATAWVMVCLTDSQVCFWSRTGSGSISASSNQVRLLITVKMSVWGYFFLK